MKEQIEELINKLQNNKKKIITQDELKNAVFSIYGNNTPISKIYKISYQLKNRGYLTTMRKELFFISSPDTKIYNEEIEEKRYRKILKDHCNEYCKQRYIGGLTALEIWLYGSGVTIPENIFIMNKEKQAVETVIFEKKVSFKKYESKEKKLFTTLIKLTNTTSVQNSGKISVADLELAILECLYNFDTTNRGYIEECIKKAIKKNGKTLNTQNLEIIIKQGKHNTSLNRLFDLTKNLYPKLADEIKIIIKKYGFKL